VYETQHKVQNFISMRKLQHKIHDSISCVNTAQNSRFYSSA